MRNDKLIDLKDEVWAEAQREAQTKGLERKAGKLREMHVELYDQATTEAQCMDIKQRMMIEVETLEPPPPELTVEERVEVLVAKRLDEFRTELAETMRIK